MSPLWLRSVRYRPVTAALLCLLSAVAVMTSVLGPLLVRAVHQSTLTDAIAAAGLGGRSLSVSSEAAADDSWDDAREAALEGVSAGKQGPSAPLWSEPRVLVGSTTFIVWRSRPAAVGANAVVSALDAGCRAYVITSGRCPGASGQAMISSADAAREKVTTGSVISFTLARAPTTKVRVVGIYDADGSAAAGLIRPGTTEGVLANVETEPVVLTAEQSTSLPLPVSITARMAARPDLAVQDVPALQDSIDKVKSTASAQDRLLAVRTQLPDLLDRVDTQARFAQLLILVTTVQALFLAIFALAVVLQRIGRARDAEWSVGRLRGVPRGRWFSSVYAEPVAAVLGGLPLGFAAGVGAARGGVALALRPGTPVEPWRWPVVASAGAATVIALGALVAVSLRSIRQPLAELVQQQAEGRRLSTVGAVVHAGVLLLAGATVYQLVTGGLLSTSGPQLGLLAPGLFALAVAMLAVRAAVLGVRRVTTRPPRTLSALVVGRHAARSPSSLNPAMIIAVGVALAVFATQLLAFSLRNQGLRADAISGASTVLRVSLPPDVDLMASVRAADPSGHQAMAVKETAAGPFSGIARIVAVDSTRLEPVASWSSRWAGVPDLGQALRGQAGAPIMLRGRSIQVDLSGVRVRAQEPPTATSTERSRPPTPPSLVVTVETRGRWQAVNLGQVKAGGSGSQRLSAPLPCPEGCRIVGLGLLAGQDSPYRGFLTVANVSTDLQPPGDSTAWLATEGRWRPQSVNQTPEPTSLATPKGTPSGLWIDAFDLQGSGLTSVSPSDVVDPMPAVLAPGTSVERVPGSPGAGYGSGLDSQQQKLRVLGKASILPRSLDDGVLVDLSNAQGLADPARTRTINEVWLAPGAPPTVEQELVARGLHVQSRELLGTTRAELQQQATTRGAAAAVIVSSAALVLTLLALVVARWAEAGRRGADWQALREGGVSRRRLRRLIRVEIAVPAVLGVVVGMLSGATAARIAGSRLPLVDLAQPGPPLDLHLSWLPVLLLGLGTVLVILVVAQVGGWAETRTRGSR